MWVSSAEVPVREINEALHGLTGALKFPHDIYAKQVARIERERNPGLNAFAMPTPHVTPLHAGYEAQTPSYNCSMPPEAEIKEM